MRTAHICLLLFAAGALLFSGLRMLAEEKPKEKSAKELAQEFVYPGAKKFGEEREGARMYQAKFTTADDPGKLWAWYSKSHGFDLGEGISFNPGQQPGIRLSVTEDTHQPGKDKRSLGDPRPLTLVVLVKKTNEIVVVAAVSRGKDEEQTHVALTFIDNKSQ